MKALACFLQTPDLLSNFLALEQKWKSFRGNFKQTIPSHPKDVAAGCFVRKIGKVKGKLMLKAREKNNASGKMFTALQSKYLFLLLTNAKAVAFTIGGRCFLSTRS